MFKKSLDIIIFSLHLHLSSLRLRYLHCCILESLFHALVSLSSLMTKMHAFVVNGASRALNEFSFHCNAHPLRSRLRWRQRVKIFSFRNVLFLKAVNFESIILNFCCVIYVLSLNVILTSPFKYKNMCPWMRKNIFCRGRRSIKAMYLTWLNFIISYLLNGYDWMRVANFFIENDQT